MYSRLKKSDIRKIVRCALKEDIGEKDITTQISIPSNLEGKAFIVANQKGVLCGINIAKEVFMHINRNLQFKALKKEGSKFIKGEKIALVKGKLSSILTGERVALNFLSFLSGIATYTERFVLKVKSSNVKIRDTRKTTPILRILEKYAVRIGGGFNHRFNLSEGIIVKDNHLRALKIVGSKKEIEKIKLKKFILFLKKKTSLPIEIEVENLKEFKEVIKYEPDIIMLDNFGLSSLKKAVIYRNEYFPHVKLEASGGINLKNIKKIARTKVDFISVGALTHSASCIDFSLEMQ